MIDISLTMLIQVINFSILLWLLNKFLYGKVLDYLDRRTEGIRLDLSEAKNLKSEAAKLKEEQDTSLVKARREASDIVRESRRQGDEERLDIIKVAEKEAEAILENGKKTIEMETKKAKTTLKDGVVDVAVEIAHKIIEREIKPKDQDKILSEVIENFDQWK